VKEKPMGRRAKPAKAKAEARFPVAPKSRKNGAPTVRDLEKRLAEALKREAEALEQQAATAEILRVISSSPTDVQPVVDIMAQSAVQLCDGLFAGVFRFDDELIHSAAHQHNPPKGLEETRGAAFSLVEPGSRAARSALMPLRHVETS
jgi:hypothetical protein